MAIALISKGIAGGSGTSASVTIDTTGANLLVVITTWYTWHTQTLTDGNSNSGWVTRTKFGTNVVAVQIRYVLNPSTVGAGHSFTINNSSGSGVAIAAYAFSGVSAFDADNGKDGLTATSRSTDLITPSDNGAILIAAIGFDNTSTETGGGTYVDLQQVNKDTEKETGTVKQPLKNKKQDKKKENKATANKNNNKKKNNKKTSEAELTE